MVNLVWNEEDAKKSYLAQGREEGREEGLAEGREVGLAEGIIKGKIEGKIEGALENIRNLMKNLNLTSEAAMNALGISSEMQKELAPLI